MSGFSPFVLILSGLVLLTTACAQPVSRLGEFEPYVRRFEQHAKDRGRPLTVTNLIVEYGKTFPPAAVASCYALPFKTPRIAVNEAEWRSIDEACREIYIFHELGHCLLYLAHTDSEGNRKDLMNYNTVDCDSYKKNRSYFLDRLFLEQESY